MWYHFNNKFKNDNLTMLSELAFEECVKKQHLNDTQTYTYQVVYRYLTIFRNAIFCTLLSSCFGAYFHNLYPPNFISIKEPKALKLINSLGPSDAIWRWGSWSTQVQVMACCLTAPSHYLNQCWHINSKVLWHSSKDVIIRRFEDTNQ